MKFRLQRVSEVLKRELGVILQRHIKVEGMLVSVRSVDVTPDLKQAHVYISAIGNDRNKESLVEELDAKRSLFQQELSKRVILKYTPILYFKLDDSIERGTRVIQIMDDLGLEHINPEKEDSDE